MLERDPPTLGLFETLESGRDDGSNRRRDEAHERMPSEREARLEGRNLEREWLREDRPTIARDSASPRTDLPGAEIRTWKGETSGSLNPMDGFGAR